MPSNHRLIAESLIETFRDYMDGAKYDDGVLITRPEPESALLMVKLIVAYNIAVLKGTKVNTHLMRGRDCYQLFREVFVYYCIRKITHPHEPESVGPTATKQQGVTKAATSKKENLETKTNIMKKSLEEKYPPEPNVDNVEWVREKLQGLGEEAVGTYYGGKKWEGVEKVKFDERRKRLFERLEKLVAQGERADWGSKSWAL